MFVSRDAVLLSPFSLCFPIYFHSFYFPCLLCRHIQKVYTHYFRRWLQNFFFINLGDFAFYFAFVLVLGIVGSILITKEDFLFLRDARSVCTSWKRKIRMFP